MDCGGPRFLCAAAPTIARHSAHEQEENDCADNNGDPGTEVEERVEGLHVKQGISLLIGPHLKDGHQANQQYLLCDEQNQFRITAQSRRDACGGVGAGWNRRRRLTVD